MSTASVSKDNNDLPATNTQEDAQRLSMTDQLCTACESGDVNNASRLLAALPEINLNTIKWSEDDEGELTLLTHAASEGHAEICQMLLDKGADVNQRSAGMVFASGYSSVGITPLIYACRNGHLKVVNVFLAVDGIDVNQRKDNGATALHSSSINGHFQAVEMLLAVDGIQVNQADNDGWTPLYVACQEGHSKIVKMLLAVNGIQVNQADEEGTTPLCIASNNGHLKIVKMLLAVDGIQVNQADNEACTPLYVACQNCHSKVVEMLLAVAGIEVNQVNNEEVTPLYMACQEGHSKVVTMLLAVDDIQVNQASDEDVTPLFIACQVGHSKVVKMLLAVDGIQVNQANKNQATPLSVACQQGRLKEVQMLLAVDGIQVNRANIHGMTPFMMAVSNSHIGIVMQLLQHGNGHNSINEWFSINKSKPSGRIALYKYAVLLPQQHQPLLDFHLCLLNTQNGFVPTSSLKAFSRIWPQLVAFKIESFLLPTKQTRRTMQQVVLYFNETLNDTDKWGKTQLYEATRKSDVDSVRFLVQQEGILLDQLSRKIVEEDDEEDQLYETPLNYAVRFVEDNGDIDDAAAISKGVQIVELLHEAGGTAREIPREEWMAEQNELMEAIPGE
jgi:ankyrin repeat protein